MRVQRIYQFESCFYAQKLHRGCEALCNQSYEWVQIFPGDPQRCVETSTHVWFFSPSLITCHRRWESNTRALRDGSSCSTCTCCRTHTVSLTGPSGCASISAKNVLKRQPVFHSSFQAAHMLVFELLPCLLVQPIQKVLTAANMLSTPKIQVPHYHTFSNSL